MADASRPQRQPQPGPNTSAEQGSAASKKRRSRRKARRLLVGRGQLSMVEHCLFPLDQDLRGKGFTHKTSYPVFRRGKRPLIAEIEVSCPHGLTPPDEHILDGLLGLAFAEKDPSPVFYATPNFVLTRLGLQSGGFGYAQLDQAMDRLEFVTYAAKNFYDPIRREFAKRISFSLVKRRVPLENEDERGWKFIFDQQFFEFAEHTHGRLKYPFDLYAKFTPAARRLFKLLRKMFYRLSVSPAFDLDELNDRILGYSPQSPAKEKKRNVIAAAKQLLDTGVIQLSSGTSRLQDEFVKLSKAKYQIAFHCGPHGKGDILQPAVQDSALYEMLLSLKISQPAIREILDTCKTHHIKEWVQITLAAKQSGVIKATPAAYFLDNIRKARVGKRGTPDWWQQLKRDEEREQQRQVGRVLRAHLREHAEAHGMTVPTFQQYLDTKEGRAAFDRIQRDVFAIFTDDRLSDAQRKNLARDHAIRKLRAEYEQKFGSSSADQPLQIGQIFSTMD